MKDRLLRGIGVSPGMAIGAAVVVQSQLPDVPQRWQTPLQALVQQTPSTQRPERHIPPSPVQACPS